MTTVRRVPPGRAGRLWLKHRIAVAERGADLLDQKLRILRGEQQRLALLTARTGAAWEAASREADTWLLRAVLLGGQRGVRLAHDSGPARVEVTWAHLMGVHYPVEATCTVPEPSATAAPPGNAALFVAVEAHRRALQVAVQLAVAEAAVRAVEAEEAATRRRLRAIEDRWVPRLQEALAQVQLGIEEQEHAEAVRLRWARERRPGLTGQTPARAGTWPGREPAGPGPGRTEKGS